MGLEPVLVVGLMLVALTLTGVVMFLSFRTMPPPAARRAALGLLARVACPVAGAPARVRIGKDAGSGVLAVQWCERFPAGTIDCDRACFAVIGEPDPEAAGAFAA